MRIKVCPECGCPGGHFTNCPEDIDADEDMEGGFASCDEDPPEPEDYYPPLAPFENWTRNYRRNVR